MTTKFRMDFKLKRTYMHVDDYDDDVNIDIILHYYGHKHMKITLKI